MKTKPQFIHKPILIPEYEQDEEITYTLDSNLIFWNGKKQIIVHNNLNGIFKTNLVTLPKWLKKLIKKLERYEWLYEFIQTNLDKMAFPAILHDGQYSKPNLFQRVNADWMLLLSCKVEGVNFFVRWLAFIMVRCFGSDYRN